MTEASRQKIREHNLRTGKVPPSRKGIPSSLEARRKVSEAHKKSGFRPPSALGIKRSEDFKRRVSENHSHYWRGKHGEETVNWQGGITKLQQLIRGCFKYRQWRSDIFYRDDFTCVWCGDRGVTIHADHIKPFWMILKENNITTVCEAEMCEELWNLNNGRTLCVPCHKTTDSYLKKPSK